MSDLTGKVALVTGASRGLGRAIALRLARDGADIAVNYATAQADADQVAEAVKLAGRSATTFQADMTDLRQIEALYDRVLATFGRLDIVVNNAGVGISAPFTALNEDQYDRIFAVAKGVYFSLKRASSVIADNGRIINLSTGLTRNWAPNAAAYAGSKAAIEQFTRSLSKELGPRGITVNVVLPGFTVTDMTAGAPDERREQARAMSSFQRLGQPDDIADIVGFLASHDARWVTGQRLVANGGSTP
jgi:3-oxoacyl-[acyl-carrier protein] reductase